MSGPGSFSAEVWIKTTSTSGGRIIGFSSGQDYESALTDRHLYMTNAGRLVLGTSCYTCPLITPDAYNDGAWHHVVASQGDAGMALYVDGTLRAQNAVAGGGAGYVGYRGQWKMGNDRLGGWPDVPSSKSLAGTFDEIAVYNRALSPETIRAHYQLALSAPPQPPSGDSFQSLTPARLLDTRPGASTVDGQAAGGGALVEGRSLSLKVTGRGGVPQAGVKAVVLNVTATQPTSYGYLTVYPTGESQPHASSSNFAPGQTVANLVIAKVGTDGQISLYNGPGSTHVIADVTGYFTTDAGFTPLNPARLMDNRPGATTVDSLDAGAGATGPATTRTLKVTGRGGVPASGVGAVVVTVTATGSTAESFLTTWPSNEAKPWTSNLNMQNGNPVSNVAVVSVGPDGQIKLYNDAGSTYLIVDVTGWFPAGSSYQPLTPARLWDTRAAAPADSPSTGEGPIQPGTTRQLKVTGRGGVPASGVGTVMVNITAVGPAAAGYLTVFPTGATRPLASTLNFTAGQVVANMAAAKVGDGGQIALYVPPEAGTTHLIVDVVGWFPG